MQNADIYIDLFSTLECYCVVNGGQFSIDRTIFNYRLSNENRVFDEKHKIKLNSENIRWLNFIHANIITILKLNYKL